MTHPAELARRLTKAEAMATLLKQAGISPFEIERLEGSQSEATMKAWDVLAEVATQKARERDPKALQFHRPSDETKRLIIKFLSWADEDPYEGVG